MFCKIKDKKKSSNKYTQVFNYLFIFICLTAENLCIKREDL